MENNLFAGLEVKGKLMTKNASQKAREATTDSPEISSLFTGLEVGGQLIEPTQQANDNIAQIGNALPVEPVNVLPPRFDIKPSPFPEAGQETRATQELPELGQGTLLGTEGIGSQLLGRAATLATTNPQELASILKSQYPFIGIQYDPAGNIVAANNKTGERVVLNKPGLSEQDIFQGLGLAAAFTPAGRAGSLAAGLAAKVGVGAVASGATQAAIELAQKELGGEFNEDEVAIASSLGGISEAVVPAIKAFREARRAKLLDVNAKDISSTVEAIKPAREAVSAIEEATGKNIGLFQAQQTQQPSTLLKQRLLPQLDAGAKQAAIALERQNKEVFDATAELINKIAPAEVVETGAKRFKTAAQSALEAGKSRRTQAVRPIYNEALESGADVDLAPTNKIIKDLLEEAPETGKFSANIKKVANLMKGSTDIDGNTVAPSLRKLQKAKFEIDEMLENFGDGALGNTTKRDVLAIKRSLVNQMEEASPLYKNANDEFSRLSPAVKELEDSLLGSISKIDDVSLKNVTKRIFDATESNPSVVRKAKKIIEQIDPGAWDDILRVEMQRRFAGIETIADDLPNELVGNVPGQLRRAIFGNPEKRRTLLSAMSNEQRKNFVYLDDVLRRASSGRQAGSPTAPFGQVLDRLRGSAGVIRDVIFNPLKTMQHIGDRSIFDRNVAKMTDILFNPKWQPRLKELREIDPNSERSAKILSGLFDLSKAGTQGSRQTEAAKEKVQ